MEKIKRFKFRADSTTDVAFAMHHFGRAGVAVYNITQKPLQFYNGSFESPEREVEIITDSIYEKKTLIDILKLNDAGHVMCETFELLEDYTGERKSEDGEEDDTSIEEDHFDYR